MLASLMLLAAMSALGIAALGRFARHLTPLERWAWGAPIGMTAGTLVLVPLAVVFPFTAPLVIAVGLVCAVTAVALAGGTGGIGWARQTWRQSPAVDAPGWPRFRRLSTGSTAAAVVIGAFALRWGIFWRDALVQRADGLWAGHVNIWGDWAVHFGIVSSFVYGANFPPEHPRFADHAFGYHYLSDLTAAAQVTLGMDAAGALALHSWIGCVLVAIGMYAFARRLTRRPTVAALSVGLFMLGGGLGWLATADVMARTGDVVGTLGERAWDREVKSNLNLQFVNMFYGFVAPQRAHLYGLPIAFATVSTLLVATRKGNVRLFVVAGVIAGLLPLAHLGTLLALALVTPFLFLLFPSRGWIVFHVVWVAVALPQLLTQLGGGAGALAAIRPQLGWVMGDDPWWWFWFKNLGLFIPLLAVAIVSRRLVPPRPRRFLLAFMVLFVAANLVAFQPWDWDNHKLFVYWFLAVSILVAAVIVRAWRAAPGWPTRIGIAAITASLVLSGVLEDLGTMLGQSRFRMIDDQQIAIAEQVRTRTPPDSLVVIGLQNRDAIAMLTGRRIFVGYPGWLWTEGVRYGDREAIVRSIYVTRDGWLDDLAEHAIDFVAIGPPDRDGLRANEQAFRERFPVVAETADWRVYDVRGLRTAGS